MEQLKTGLDNNLNEQEMKNVYLAVACGCLKTIKGIVPGPEHSKKKRVLMQLHDEILQTGSRRLPRVSPKNLEMFKDVINASAKVLDDILKETGKMGTHVMLNLVGFCMENVPLDKKHFRKYNALFDLWEEAYQYEDTRAGDRVFERIGAEVKILVAQRGGVIL